MSLNIKGKVSFLDLVDIHVSRGVPTPGNLFPLTVSFTPHDRTKNVIFDEKALKTLNHKVTERIREMRLKANDDRTYDYIREYVGRLSEELYKCDLVAFEEATEAPEDPYEEIRKKYRS